jgi:hypothetical protein
MAAEPTRVRNRCSQLLRPLVAALENRFTFWGCNTGVAGVSTNRYSGKAVDSTNNAKAILVTQVKRCFRSCSSDDDGNVDSVIRRLYILRNVYMCL